MKAIHIIAITMFVGTALSFALPAATATDCVVDNIGCVCTRGGSEDCTNSRGQSCAVVVTPFGKAAAYGVDCRN